MSSLSIKEQAHLDLQGTLDVFRGKDLLRRQNMRLSNESEDGHDIYFYPIMYLGKGMQVVVYRDGDARRSTIGYALYDDINSFYTPQSVGQLVAYIDAHAEPHITLKELMVYAKDVRRRVELHMQ